MIVDIGGFAAMDPVRENRVVTLSEYRDDCGVALAHTRLRPTAEDQERSRRLCDRIREVGQMLGRVEFLTKDCPAEAFAAEYTPDNRVQIMPPGRSYHEAGTLRMGRDPNSSVTDERGKVHGVPNLFVADAGLFPSVGIANPMLTITALAYHVAESALGNIPAV
jgi:choline dehydrogenase-like flavoprotein